MNEKVIITIEKGRYAPSHKNGAEYYAVDYQASWYGAGSTCDTKEMASLQAKEFCKAIREYGDIPIVKNYSQLNLLSSF